MVPVISMTLQRRVNLSITNPPFLLQAGKVNRQHGDEGMGSCWSSVGTNLPKVELD